MCELYSVQSIFSTVRGTLSWLRSCFVGIFNRAMCWPISLHSALDTPPNNTSTIKTWASNEEDGQCIRNSTQATNSSTIAISMSQASSRPPALNPQSPSQNLSLVVVTPFRSLWFRLLLRSSREVISMLHSLLQLAERKKGTYGVAFFGGAL